MGFQGEGHLFWGGAVKDLDFGVTFPEIDCGDDAFNLLRIGFAADPDVDSVAIPA